MNILKAAITFAFGVCVSKYIRVTLNYQYMLILSLRFQEQSDFTLIPTYGQSLWPKSHRMCIL